MHTLTHGDSYEPTPTVFRLPRWRWGKLAAARVELERVRGQVAKLELELVARDAASRDMASAHATELLLVEAEAEARSVVRIDAAVTAVREAATRTAADVAEQHAAALAFVRTRLDGAEARAAKLEQDLPLQIEVVRREAATLHEAQLWAQTTQAATQLEAARRDAAAALATQATRLDAQAAAQVAAAVRTFQSEAADALAGTVKQHNAAIALVRAELEDVEKRRARLEQDLPAEMDRVRREANTAHEAQMALVEELAAARLDSTRRDAETALALLAQELDTQASAHLDATLRAARDEAARATAATAQQHAGELAAMRAQLGDLEARRATLERDLPTQVDTVRREAAAAHANEVTMLRAHAAEQVEAAVREARDEAAQEAANAVRRHQAALARLRDQREEAEARVTRLEQELSIELVRRREAGVAHAAEVAALQTQADARIEAAVSAARDDAARATSEMTRQHATALAVMQVDLNASEARRAQLEQDIPNHLEAGRREASVVHAAEVAALRTQAAVQAEAVIREARDEAVRAAADAAVRHDAALAAVRHEREEAEARCVRLDQDLAVHIVLRREAGIAHAAEVAALHTQATARVDAAVAKARDEAARAAAEVAGRHALALGALRNELDTSEARLAKLEDELPTHIDAVRRDAEATHMAAVAALRAQAAAQIETAVHEAHEEAARAAALAPRAAEPAAVVESSAELAGPHVVAVMRRSSTVHETALLTGALVVSGLAGSLVGWSVAFWGLLY